jgi:type I restriction enzyme S subunit
LQICREIKIFIPPIKEQLQIVEFLVNYFNFNNMILKALVKTNEKLEVLSILSKAFSGALGTNDPLEQDSFECIKNLL